nr:ankyrin repeat domain-containing protein 26-like [Bubalus bubalis]
MPLGGSTILSPQAMNSAPEKGLLGMGKQTQATKGCVYGPPCSNAVLPLPKTPPPAGQLQEAQDQLTEAVRCAEKTRDHVQKLEIENVKLQTTVKKQVGKIEELRKKLLSTRSFEDEKEQLKKYIELKQSLENNLDQEKKKNSEFKKEITGLMILQQSWKLHLQNVCTWMQKIKFFERSYYL